MSTVWLMLMVKKKCLTCCFTVIFNSWHIKNIVRQEEATGTIHPKFPENKCKESRADLERTTVGKVCIFLSFFLSFSFRFCLCIFSFLQPFLLTSCFKQPSLLFGSHEKCEYVMISVRLPTSRPAEYPYVCMMVVLTELYPFIPNQWPWLYL